MTPIPPTLQRTLTPPVLNEGFVLASRGRRSPGTDFEVSTTGRISPMEQDHFSLGSLEARSPSAPQLEEDHFAGECEESKTPRTLITFSAQKLDSSNVELTKRRELFIQKMGETMLHKNDAGAQRVQPPKETVKKWTHEPAQSRFTRCCCEIL